MLYLDFSSVRLLETPMDADFIQGRSYSRYTSRILYHPELIRARSFDYPIYSVRSLSPDSLFFFFTRTRGGMQVSRRTYLRMSFGRIKFERCLDSSLREILKD